MKTTKTTIMVFIASLFCIGCASCNIGGDEPYIRTQPGIEYCGPFCDKMKEMDCKPYYEDIEFDGGIMTCKEFCEYEMSNSVQLNPKCIVEKVTECSQVETICN